MMSADIIQNTIAISLLFWPIVFLITITICTILLILLFFIGGTLSISIIFFYGIYALLRDLGYLKYFYKHYSNIKKYIGETLLHNIRESFIIDNLQSGGIENNKPVLYICHPHGLYGMSWFIHFAACLTTWPHPLTLPKLAIHSIFFKLPFIREFMIEHKCIEATEIEIIKAIKEGHSVAIILGGIEELNYTKEGQIQLIIKKRKGYIRIAKQMGISIIPLITVGENEIFPFVNFKILNLVQQFLYNNLKLSIPIPSWKSLLAWLNLANKPLETKLQTYILNPVSTYNKTETEIRLNYINSIEQFSNSHGNLIEIVG